MITKQMAQIRHCMTPETMDAFIQSEMNKGASENMIRRYKGTLKVIGDFLPEDKCITKERLLAWRKSMEDNGYASITILNYVKYINRYLDFVGCSEIRFNQGKAKDITGMTFGYLTAIEPTGAKNRNDYVWLFQCKCGGTIELPASRVLNGHTLSCGCLKGAHLKKALKICGGTSLVHSLNEKVESKNSISGYVGVSPKRDKWQAHIMYKGVNYSLGTYYDLNEAVKARARGKELVMEDAQGLLDFYAELEKEFPQLSNMRKEAKKEFPKTEWITNAEPTTAAKRSDNTSGHPGVGFHLGKWNAKICYQGIRYTLGRFSDLDEAVAARKNAEQLLKEDPTSFLAKYKDYPQYSTKKGL